MLLSNKVTSSRNRSREHSISVTLPQVHKDKSSHNLQTVEEDNEDPGVVAAPRNRLSCFGRLAAVCSLVAIMTFVIAANYQHTVDTEHMKAISDFETHSGEAISTIQRALERFTFDLQSLGRVLTGVRNLTMMDYQYYADDIRASRPAEVARITYALKVATGARSDYEAKYFPVWGQRLPQPTPFPSNATGPFFPITYLVPVDTSFGFFGYDESFAETDRMGVFSAINSTKTYFQEPVVFPETGKAAWKFHQAVYDERNVTNTIPVPDRLSHTIGLLSFAVRAESLVNSLLKTDTTTVGLVLCVTDTTTGQDYACFESTDTSWKENHYHPAASSVRFHARQSLTAGSRTVTINAYALSQFVEQYSTNDAVVMTIVLSALLLVLLLLLGTDSYRSFKNTELVHMETQARRLAANETRRRKKVEMTNDAKRQFLNFVFHEARVPFNAVVLGLESLSGANLPDMWDEVVKLSLVSATHVTRILNDVLDLQKIESGKLELRLAQTSVSRIVASTEQYFKQMSADSQVPLMFHIDPAVDVTFVGDEQRLIQCVSNFVSNAIKFTPPGGTVTVKVQSPTPKEVERLGDIDTSNQVPMKFSVTDTGGGISPEDQLKLFQPFNQGKNAHSGSGLGLSLVLKLIKLHGGYTDMVSQLGHGSCFSFTFAPTIVGEENRQVSLKGQQELLKDLIAGKHMLVVEDSKPSRRLLGVLLHRFGVTVDFAENGKIAVEAVRDALSHERLAWDLILMDQAMPVMDGIEATRRIRAMGVDTPIVSLSGNAFDQDVQQFRDAGSTASLSKPFQMKEFVQVALKLFGAEPSHHEQLLPTTEDDDSPVNSRSHSSS